MSAERLVGVLALQGAFREHENKFRGLGARVREVRLPDDLYGLDALVIPGGESTTMGKLMEEFGLAQPLRDFARQKPVLGTCAGLIMLAKATVETAQPLLGVLDVTVRRNAFGRQVHSFEGPVELRWEGAGRQTFPGVFIRAPWVEKVGPGVEVVALYEGKVVGVRQGHLLGFAFHPELTNDSRLHQGFLELVDDHARRSRLAPVA